MRITGRIRIPQWAGRGVGLLAAAAALAFAVLAAILLGVALEALF